jgi:hypothetical protein
MDASAIVDCTRRGDRIKGFAENLTQCFQACNEQCVRFINFINQQTFKNEKEIGDALKIFRSTVIDTAEGSRVQKQKLCDQIEFALLNPSKVVTDKVIQDSRGRKIDQSIVKLLMPGSCVASPRKCSVCNEGCGIMVTCSSQRCKKPLLHPGCAGQITSSKKNACNYYRCPSCVRPVPAAKPKSKRSSRGVKQPLKKPKPGSSDGEASKNDGAAAGTSQGSASKNSASDGSASDGSASDGSASDGSASDGSASEGSASEGSDQLNDAGNLRLPRSELQSQHTHNDLSDDLAVFESACGKIVFIRDLARSVHEDLKAAQLSVGGSVTVENADKVEVVLNQIKSGVDSLAKLALSYRLAYGMPANPFPVPLVVGASDAHNALSNGCSHLVAFDQHLEHIYGQFDGLKSQANVVVPASQHMCALPADPETSTLCPLRERQDHLLSSPMDGLVASTGSSSGAMTDALTPSAVQPFFTVSKCTDVVLELSDRFKCNFSEHTNRRGKLIKVQSQPDKPWTSARHFVSDKYVAKVYRISSVAGSSQFSSRDLSQAKFFQALHESAATAYICREQSWFHDVFGVLIYDSDAVHIHTCIIRERLNSQNVTPVKVSDACISLLRSFGVMHGDGHIGNAKLRIGSDVIELLDFDRAFMIPSSDELIEMIRKYAFADGQQRQTLLLQMKQMGMKATRLRFEEFVTGCRVSNINDWTLDDILSVFKGTQLSSDTLSIERFLGT